MSPATDSHGASLTRAEPEVAAIAARLEQAFAGGAEGTSKALDEYATDPLDVGHVPAHPSDGAWDKAAFIAARHAWDESLAGVERTCAVTSAGSRIEIVQTIGLVQTGRNPLRATIRSVWTVEGGRLVSVVGHHPDSDAERAIREALDTGRPGSRPA